MATELPVELWAKIVEQLPPPPPKLVPRIIIVPTGGPGGRVCCIHISKAVSVDERDQIAGAWMPHTEWEDVGTHWTRGNYNWNMVSNICMRAEFLGYSYCTESDKARVDSRTDSLNRIRMFK